MKNDKIYPEILSMVLITQVSEGLKADLQLSEEHTSCAVITATIDDFVFLALDEATKKADVDVTYTGSFMEEILIRLPSCRGRVLASSPERLLQVFRRPLTRSMISMTADGFTLSVATMRIVLPI